MSIFSFHLVETTVATAAGALLRSPTKDGVRSLHKAECLTVMTLGSPILSAARMQLRHFAFFAAWESIESLDDFLGDTSLGRTLAAGWHVRLELLRRWGSVSGFDDIPPSVREVASDEPVVAVTLARLKVTQLARFIRWGKPVEQLVRDHPGTTLALAAIRPPRTFSTFSVWRSQTEMINMVRGRDATPGADRHAAAMAERNRKDFHHEFTTLRFRPLSEHGSWQGRCDIVPKSGAR